MKKEASVRDGGVKVLGNSPHWGEVRAADDAWLQSASSLQADDQPPNGLHLNDVHTGDLAIAPAPISDPLAARAAAMSRDLVGASPAEIIAAAVGEIGRDRLALVSSFGTESAALLKVMADVDPAIPVVFLDTGWLFDETLAYRDTLIAKLGLKDVRSIKPLESDLAASDPDRELWFNDPDRCCFIRKVEPLRRALAGFDGWINGRKRFQGGFRAELPVVEADGTRLKFNPFANVSAEDIALIYDSANLPQHPLKAQGFFSVGCMPCTSRGVAGEETRAGRWRGRGKTECGIHTMTTA